MASTSSNTDPWVASRLPEQQVSFMKKYFEDLDSETEAGAKDWATSWADGGEFVQGKKVFTGRKALEEERYRVWKTWPGLYHVIKSIFVLPGAEDFNFIVVASYVLKRPDYSLIERDTAANYHLVEREGNLKIQRLEIYADPGPLLEALQ